MPSQPSTEAGTCLGLFITSIGQSIWGRGTGRSGWLVFCCSEEPLCSLRSRGEVAVLLKDAHWDFHKIKGFLALRGGNAVFSYLVIFFFNFPVQTEAEGVPRGPQG